VYLLADGNYQPVVGNLTFWPRVAPGETGRVGRWFEFDMQVRAGGVLENHRVRAAVVNLPGQYRLLVGTDIVERMRFEEVMARVGAWSVLLVVVMGSGIGVWMNRRLLRQVNSISAAGQQIANGDFTRRLPVSGSGDELDEMAGGLNTLLGRIEQLTMALRFVIDGTAHDLRSPLNRLRVRVEQALAQAEAGQRELLEAVLADADAVLRTLDALLRIAQAQGGGPGAEMSHLDFGVLAREMSELYAPLAEERGLGFHIGTLESGEVHGSRQLLAHAIANLLDNAVKYTPAGGDVRVSVTADAAAVELRIQDSGPGIPAADRDRVLQRFVRLESAQAQPGSGLGLSLVAAVCRLHHAELGFEDASPGLIVKMRLPRSNKGSAEAANPAKK
jgi:signal transduction histidine kinase